MCWTGCIGDGVQQGKAISDLANGSIEAPTPVAAPAVPVRKSVTPDYLVCLEDGRKFKSLKRHLKSKYGGHDEVRMRDGEASVLLKHVHQHRLPDRSNVDERLAPKPIAVH